MESTFVNSSQKKPFLWELEDPEAVIPEGKLEFLAERTRNNLYSFIILKFLEAKGSSGLSNAKLARRIGYDPARLSRVLGAPGNWTIKTVSDLLVGIAAEELEPASSSLVEHTPRNYRGQDIAPATYSPSGTGKSEISHGESRTPALGQKSSTKAEMALS